jgi:hypothetical protein
MHRDVGAESLPDYGQIPEQHGSGRLAPPAGIEQSSQELLLNAVGENNW